MTILKNGIKVINLCAHELDFDSGDKVPPCGFVLGCEIDHVLVQTGRIKLQTTKFVMDNDQLVRLKALMQADPDPDVLFITSAIARDAYSVRLAKDSRRLVSPILVGDIRAAKKMASADSFSVTR